MSKNVTMELKVFHLNIDIKLFMKSTEQLLVNSFFIYFATKKEVEYMRLGLVHVNQYLQN